MYEGGEKRAPLFRMVAFTVQNPVPGLLNYTYLKWRCHISIAAQLVAIHELGQFRPKTPWCAVVACGACPHFCSAWDGSDCRYSGFLKRIICSQPGKATKKKSLF